MKRFLAPVLIAGIASCGLVGCEEKSKVEKTTTVTTPNGTDTVKSTVEEKKTGDQKDNH